MYSAQIHSTGFNGTNGHWLTPICPSIKALEAYLVKSFNDGFICDPKVIDQVVVLKARKYKLPQIHGFYDWVDGKLKLDRNKPVGVHNAIFFGETDD